MTPNCAEPRRSGLPTLLLGIDQNAGSQDTLDKTCQSGKKQYQKKKKGKFFGMI